MAKRWRTAAGRPQRCPVPRGLFAFCFALLGPAFAVNGAFIALAIPAMAAYGVNGLVLFGLAGAVFGIFPALWLARRINEGLQEK